MSWENEESQYHRNKTKPYIIMMEYKVRQYTIITIAKYINQVKKTSDKTLKNFGNLNAKNQ